MCISVLSIIIISCKIISLICFLISVYSYNWFEIDDYSVNKGSIQYLCTSYGAFCNIKDQMPLPHLIIIIPCLLTGLAILLEIVNISFLYSIRKRIRSMLNFFLEQTNIALSCAMIIHCIWITVVHIRISMEMSIVHLKWTFFIFAFGTMLIPIDCICSIIRIMKNCHNENNNQGKHNVQVYTCRHRSIIDSDI